MKYENLNLLVWQQYWIDKSINRDSRAMNAKMFGQVRYIVYTLYTKKRLKKRLTLLITQINSIEYNSSIIIYLM